MFRTNVSIMREMHHTHFFDPECNTCIMILNQYYNHFMGALGIEDYYETRNILSEIDSIMTSKFKGYDGKGFTTINKNTKGY